MIDSSGAICGGCDTGTLDPDVASCTPSCVHPYVTSTGGDGDNDAVTAEIVGKSLADGG